MQNRLRCRVRGNQTNSTSECLNSTLTINDKQILLIPEGTSRSLLRHYGRSHDQGVEQIRRTDTSHEFEGQLPILDELHQSFVAQLVIFVTSGWIFRTMLDPVTDQELRHAGERLPILHRAQMLWRSITNAPCNESPECWKFCQQFPKEEAVRFTFLFGSPNKRKLRNLELSYFSHNVCCTHLVRRLSKQSSCPLSNGSVWEGAKTT